MFAPTASVTDLDSVRRHRQTTLLLQVAHVRRDTEVHRQIGVNDAATFAQLHHVLVTCFNIPAAPADAAPWHFYEHYGARGSRIDPHHTLGEFLSRPGQSVDFTWGLWDFQLTVADLYPRDAGTPQALCVGGSGAFNGPFDITEINAQLTGRETIDAVLDQVHPEVRSIIRRSKLFDFVPLLQAIDLERPVHVSPAVAEAVESLPREVTMEGRETFWATALALSCLGDAELTRSVRDTTLEALGWEDGPLAQEPSPSCDESLRVLESIGACGPAALAPVDRLDIFRALLRRAPASRA